MESYSDTFRLTVSSNVASIAAKVGKGFDPDTGGEHSFSPDITGYNGDNPIYGNTLSTSTPCTPAFKAQAEYLMSDANALYAALQSEYASRWPELTAPTLAECQAFVAAIVPQDGL